MILSRADFTLMRWNIAAILSSVLLSGSILYASNQYASHADKDFRAANDQMRVARSSLNNAHLDKEYLATYSRDYAALEKREIIGEERRLDWMEGLDRLNGLHMVMDFSYTISPQQIYTPQPAVDSGNLDINYSEMKMHFDLLHEGQLLNFFDALRLQIKGQYLLEGCTLQRATIASSDEDGIAAPATTNITADCVGGWISLRNRNAQS